MIFSGTELGRDFSSKTISLLSSAIRLAEKGFSLSHSQALLFNSYKNDFALNKAASKIFIRKDDRPWKQGDRFLQKDLAKTLKRIAKFGIDGSFANCSFGPCPPNW